MRLLDAVVDLVIIAFIFAAPMATGHFIFSNTFPIIISIIIGLTTFVAEALAFYILFKRLDRKEKRYKNEYK